MTSYMPYSNFIWGFVWHDYHYTFHMRTIALSLNAAKVHAIGLTHFDVCIYISYLHKLGNHVMFLLVYMTNKHEHHYVCTMVSLSTHQHRHFLIYNQPLWTSWGPWYWAKFLMMARNPLPSLVDGVGYDRIIHIFLAPTMLKLLDHTLEQWNHSNITFCICKAYITLKPFALVLHLAFYCALLKIITKCTSLKIT